MAHSLDDLIGLAETEGYIEEAEAADRQEELDRLRRIETAAQALGEPYTINAYQSLECTQCGAEAETRPLPHDKTCAWVVLREALKMQQSAASARLDGEAVGE